MKTNAKRLTTKQREKLNETIISNLQEFPSNISEALRLSSRQANVTFPQAKHAYYGRPSRNSLGLKQTKPCFITVTPSGFHINKKTLEAIKTTKRTLKLSEELISMDDLSVSEKVAFFDVIFG